MWNWPGFRLFIPEKDSISFAEYAMNLKKNNAKQGRKKGRKEAEKHSLHV